MARDLGTLGGADSYAYGINDAGQVVGDSTTQAGSLLSRAFLYDSGGMHELGTLGSESSVATSINNLGQIVGYFWYPQHAFIYSGGVMQDLDRFLLPHPDWSGVSATAINDHGVILVSASIGEVDGGQRAYLLTPTPGPLLTLHPADPASFGNDRLSFWAQPPGRASATQALTLTNEGELPVTIDSVSLTGPSGAGAADPAFAIAADSGGGTLAPGASRRVQITFTPAADGSFSAALVIRHNDPRPAAPRLILLAGTRATTPPPPPSVTPPAAPTGLAARVPSAHEVDLTWTDHSTDEQAFAIWRTGGGADWARVGIMGPGATSYTDTAVRPNTGYSYIVRAINHYGASDWSNKVDLTTGPPPPAAPSDLTAAVAGSSATLTWLDHSPDEQAFAIWRTGGGQDWARVGIMGPGATSYTDTGLRPGTSYAYKVRAIGRGGASGWSNPVSVLTPAAP